MLEKLDIHLRGQHLKTVSKYKQKVTFITFKTNESGPEFINAKYTINDPSNL